MSEWEYKPYDESKAENLGIIEFEVDDGEFVYFHVVKPVPSDGTIRFGGVCNTGFLESGYIEYDDDFELNYEALSELYEDLVTYYRDGKEYCTRIVCNERM
jgi:hypothetical protein